MTVPAPENPPTEELETKVEETEEKLEEAKSDPEYASKADIAALTTMLEGFRTELAEAKKPTPKPKVEPPAKKVEPKTETPPKVEEEKKEVPAETPYGNARWFNRKKKEPKS